MRIVAFFMVWLERFAVIVSVARGVFRGAQEYRPGMAARLRADDGAINPESAGPIVRRSSRGISIR
jgi:hypothetical protein